MKPAERAVRVDKFLAEAMPLIPVMGFVLGVFLSRVFLGLQPFVPWLFGTMTLAGALRLRARELGMAASSPLPFLLYLFTTRILIISVVFIVSRLIIKDDPNTISGFVLMYSVPAAVSSFIWVSVLKGDPAFSLALILLDTILAPFVVPGTVQLLLGAKISLDMTGMALSLMYMVVIPTIVGVTLNETSKGKIPDLVCPWLSPLSKLCLVIVIAANSAAVAPLIRPDNPTVWIVVIMCICFNIFCLVCGRIMGGLGKLDKQKQITFFLTSGLRNYSAAMVLGIQFFPVAAAMPAVLGIMTQHVLAGTVGRFLAKKSK